MGRRLFEAAAALGVAMGMVAVGSSPAEAQVQVGVRVDWDWGSVSVRAGDDDHYRDRRYVDYREARYRDLRYVEVRGFRIPRGHRPAFGMCRLWYPGVAPGQQPRPVPCQALGGRFHPDVLIVTWDRVLAPDWGFRRAGYARVVYRDRDWRRGDYRIRWDDDDRWDGRWYDDRYDRYDDRYDDRRGKGADYKANPARARGNGRRNGRGN